MKGEERRGKLVAEQTAFRVKDLSGGIAAEAPAGSEHAVERDDDRDRIAAAGLPDGARVAAEKGGKRAIAARLAVGDRHHGVAHPALEGRLRRNEGKVEGRPVAGEVLGELRCGVVEERRRALLEAGRKIDGADGARSEEHTSELQSLMRTSYAGFCL